MCMFTWKFTFAPQHKKKKKKKKKSYLGFLATYQKQSFLALALKLKG